MEVAGNQRSVGPLAILSHRGNKAKLAANKNQQQHFVAETTNSTENAKVLTRVSSETSIVAYSVMGAAIAGQPKLNQKQKFRVGQPPERNSGWFTWHHRNMKTF